VGAGHVVLVARARPSLERRQVVDLLAVVLTPALLAAYFLWTALSTVRPWVGWAMNGDAANNMIMTRQVLTEGGLLREQGNPAPLSTVLASSWSAPGADVGSASALVRHLVLGSGHLSLVLIGLIGVLGSVLALQVASSHAGRRIAVGAVAGLLPWLWCVAGFTFAYGFQNAPPAMVILLLAWISWLAHQSHPVSSLTGLILATWAAAVCWGPVVLVPAFWMLAAAVAERRALLRAGRALVMPAVALAGAASYAFLITLPDLRATGGVPGVDGGHPNYDHRWSLGIGVGLSLLVLVAHRRLRPALRWGYWVAVPAVGLSVLQLMRAREAAELPAWGYYPIKLTWIIMSVLLVVLFSELQAPLGRWARRWWAGSGVLLAAAVPVAMMFQVTPPLRPVTLVGTATPVLLHDNVGADAAFERMFALMEQDRRTIVSGYARGPNGLAEDSLINFWLFQSGAEDLNSGLRFPAYSMDSSQPDALCQGILAWGDGVRVVTRNKSLREDLEKACGPGIDYTVVMSFEAGVP